MLSHLNPASGLNPVRISVEPACGVHASHPDDATGFAGGYGELAPRGAACGLIAKPEQEREKERKKEAKKE
jgi:hypothetical protein